MGPYYGDFPVSHADVCMPFGTFAASTGAPTATTNFAAGDIQIYKDGGTTQRSSSSGITVSTSFDGGTGLQMVVIDLSDNTDAGFYATGHEYQVAVADITADGQTLRFWLGSFSIERAGGILALLKATGTVKVDSVKINGNTAGAVHLDTIFNTDYATVYDTTNKAFLSKLGNFAMGGSSLALTTGAVSGTTLTFSGAVAFQSTFAVTTSTSLGALSCTTLTASGAVAFQSTFGVTGAVTFSSTFATTGTATFNALTVTNALTVSGATTLTGAVTASNASNNIVGVDVAKINGTAQTAKDLGAINVTNLNTLSGHDPGSTLGTSTLTQAQVTGGAYTVQSSSCVLGDVRVANLDAAVTSRMATYTQPTGFLAATFPGTVASTTNITGGTITTVTNLTNDPAGVTTLLSRVPAALFSGITSLGQWLGLLAGKQSGNSTARAELRATGAGSGTFDETTDSQEAIRDRGDGAWATATGFSTHTAADVWAVATRLLTAGTNIVLAKGTGVTGFNDIAASAIVSNGAITTSGGAVSTVTTLTNKTDFSLAATGLDLIVPADPSAVPALGTTTLPQWIAIFGCWSLDAVSQSATATVLKNDAGTPLIHYTTTDTGALFVSGKGTDP